MSTPSAVRFPDPDAERVFITNSRGEFYRGTAYGSAQDWTADKAAAFDYSRAVARRRIETIPAFAGCTLTTK